MNPDLLWWGHLGGLLATEALFVMLVAWIVSLWLRSPQLQRALWQAALLGTALLWLAEISGAPGQLSRLFRPDRNHRSPLALSAATPSEELKSQTISSAVPATTIGNIASPVWWPGQLWFMGFVLLASYRLLSHAGLMWWVRRSCSVTPSLQVATPPGDLTNITAPMCLRLGLNRVRVLVRPGLRGPVAFGVWRPTVVLPEDFTERFLPAQREAMLAHELAHLAARDPLWYTLADFACALAWWHPAMWWARRKLRAAGETAADGAASLLPGGRIALAESLISCGRELASSGWARGIGVGGDGLKSQLARRVKALVNGTGEWRSGRPSHLWALRTGSILILSVLAAGPWPGGNSSSLLALVAESRAAEPIITIPQTPAGRIPAAEDTDANATLPPPTLATTGRAGIVVQLKKIVLPEFSLQSWTLSEAVQLLSKLARQQDPEHRGVNFVINSEVDEAITSTFINPQTGIPIKIEPPDLYLAVVHRDEVLRNVRLIDAVQAIVISCKTAITASVEDSAVVFHRQNPPPVEQLHTRRYNLPAREFLERVAPGLPAGGSNVQVVVRRFFTTNGVNFPSLVNFTTSAFPPQEQKAIFYKDRMGLLLVRATLDDLDRIDRLLASLKLPPAEKPGKEAGPPK